MPRIILVAISVPGYLLVENLGDFIQFPNDQDSLSTKSGGTAHVIMAKLKDANAPQKYGFTDVAVKFVHSDAKNYKKIYENFRYEISLMSAIPDSPYIVKMVGFCNHPMTIIMKQYMTNLAECLENKSFFKEHQSRRLKASLEIALGMEIIHSKDIVHFDLKPGKF